jgi:putative DNA primase/helicase
LHLDPGDGCAGLAMQYPSTDEEAEKVALSVLMNGDPVVLIDNIERPLKGAWLCSILTSETHQGRMLGRNEMISVPTTTLFLATGNKLVIEGDLRTRALLCRIDPKHENPQSANSRKT